MKTRKFSRRTAREILAGKVKGRIRTRDGRPVRILTFDAIGDHPIAGLIYMHELDAELSWQWTRQGVAFGHSDHSTLDFNLVLELQSSSMARCQRASKKKRKKQ